VEKKEVKVKGMTSIANGMGFDDIVSVPESKIPEFCNQLVNKYGSKKSRMMVIRQLTYRKGIVDDPRDHFQEIWNYLNKNFRIIDKKRNSK
jgi:hypothetical protein